MIKLKREIIRDSFVLEDGNGNEKELPYVINVPRIVDKIVLLRGKIGELNEANEIERLNATFEEFVRVLFGEDVASALFEFYTDEAGIDYNMLAIDITPILTEQIYPIVDRERQRIIETRKSLKSKAK